jgi:hypothetical protein
MRRVTRVLAALTGAAIALTTGATSATATTDPLSSTRLALQRAGVSSGTAGVALPERGSTVSAGDLTIRYPQAAATSRTVDQHTKVFEGRHFDQVVQSTGQDAVRMLTVLTDRSAPTTYDYSFDGQQLRPLDDGYVGVFDAETGEPVALIEPAWAKDANGAAVPTRYEIDGSTLTQVVDVDQNTAFPVVADPSVSKHWWGLELHFTKRETQAIAVSAGACATLLSFIPSVPTTVIAGVCKVATVWAGAAVTYRKCVAVKRLWTGQVIPWYWSCKW